LSIHIEKYLVFVGGQRRKRVARMLGEVERRRRRKGGKACSVDGEVCSGDGDEAQATSSGDGRLRQGRATGGSGDASLDFGHGQVE
jgi:hypothetical protein